MKGRRDTHGASLCRAIRIAYWVGGTVLAAIQMWTCRFWASADGIAYLDLSDAVLPEGSWNHLITGVWSPLYPWLLGLVRRLFSVDPYHEVVAAHLVGLPIFLFAFLTFDYLLRGLIETKADASYEGMSLPDWVYWSVGYSVFLWAALAQVTLSLPRPDLLMDGFVYGALGLVLRIHRCAGGWLRFVVLGCVLGVAYLAKAPMLPIGAVILACSAFLVRDYRRGMAMATVAAIFLLAIGSLYYVPLSRARGHLTFGESGRYNYLIYANGVGPTLYAQNLGGAKGRFVHKPTRIFSHPAAYAFPIHEAVTHPLRYDPSYWTEGLRPRFHPRAQLRAMLDPLRVYLDTLPSMGGLLVGLLVLCFLTANDRATISGLLRYWPLSLTGLAGVLLYAPVHVEPRYIGVFWAVLWLGLISGMRTTPGTGARAANAVAGGIVLSLVIPLSAGIVCDTLQTRPTDTASDAARHLKMLGVQPGDRAARISGTYGDLGWTRAARVSIVSEVAFDHANDFWSCSPEKQAELLEALARSGAKFVVARMESSITPPGWQALGTTRFCFRSLHPGTPMSRLVPRHLPPSPVESAQLH